MSACATIHRLGEDRAEQVATQLDGLDVPLCRLVTELRRLGEHAVAELLEDARDSLGDARALLDDRFGM